MQEQLTQLLEQAMSAVTAADTEAAVEDLRVHYLGKKGLLTEQLKALGKLPPAERPQMGQRLNQAKQTLQDAIQTRKQRLQTETRNRQLGTETRATTGQRHEIGIDTQLLKHLPDLKEAIFLGFRTDAENG